LPSEGARAVVVPTEGDRVLIDFAERLVAQAGEAYNDFASSDGRP
jgi:hypothetical protein